MALNPEELRNANERVLEGEERIAEQKERVAQLERDGGDDTAAAREMLVILENSQSLLVARRDLLMRQK
jgi:hypothetical protein